MKVPYGKPILVIIITIIAIVSLFVIGNDLMFTAYSDRGSTGSIDESIKSKVFIKKIEVGPKVIYVDKKPIRILECWIEKEARIYKLLSYRFSKHLGHYRLCFKVKYPDEMGYEYSFDFKGLTEGAGALQPELNVSIYHTFIDKDKPQNVEVMLLHNNLEIDKIIVRVE